MEGRSGITGKQIGMLTYHQCHNYGAMLCAYALQKKVTDIGYSAEYIDIDNEIFVEHGKKAGHQLYRRQDMEASRYKAIYRGDLKRRWESFENFKKNYLQCSEVVENEEQAEMLVENYDILLVGGDQLWNEELPVSRDIFVLPFTTGARKISFGTSMGAAKSMSLSRRMYLKKFKSIGVRETFAADFIKKYTGVPVVVTVDPVFLLEKERWEQFSESPRDSNYIFVYLFNNDNKEFSVRLKQLCSIANRYKKKIVFCGSDILEAGEGLDVRIDISPREWLGYILNAEFVITNSFHGAAFSVIFEKNFMCLDRDCRKEELLLHCGLKKRMYQGLSAYEYIKNDKIDYCHVKHILKERVDRSKEFLESELG